MPFILGLLGIAAAAYFLVIRARNTAHMAEELLDVANDVRLAARRFGFARRGQQHPVEAIEDPAIAMAALGSAFLELDDLPSQEQRIALTAALARESRVNTGEAEEMLVLGRWIMTQCGSPDAAVTRLARKLQKMQGHQGFQPVMNIIQAVAQSGSGQLGARQRAALDDLRRAFRIS